MIEWVFCGSLRLSRSENILGIPLYKNSGSNEVFVPETDDDLNITRFCLFGDVDRYDVDYFCALEFQRARCRVGDPVIVPFWIDGHSQAVWGDIDLADLQRRYPPPDQGLDVLWSVRQVRSASGDGGEDAVIEESLGRADELVHLLDLDPANTKHWLNLFKFGSGRTPNSRTLDAGRAETARAVAMRWLKHWHLKGSYELCLEVLGNGYQGYLSRGEVEHVVFAQYLQRVLSGIGRTVSKKEISVSHKRFFPKGLLFFLRESYRPTKYKAFLSEIDMVAPSYDEAHRLIEGSFESSFVSLVREDRLHDALQLVIQIYGVEDLPRATREMISFRLSDMENNFYAAMMTIRYAQAKTPQEHLSLHNQAVDLYGDIASIELFNRMLRGEARLSGEQMPRIDMDTREELEAMAEEHSVFGRV
ncbi:hypothetical protein [Antarcticirhabdus aurantiaca]|uniref:Uncharacterized protein n=1 Tax=Antarcticirhabdus aurantiaca TaxID=2606717 RepID=A0ACD4NK80_9HYPH|nr:hypothetical protein [Antarcticirhabdus aurantiaca]WAJ27273.1 hypothetical protein OXU80_20825 [Jeongeuplla avenae]